EDEVLHIAPRELLEEVARLGVHQDVVAGLEPLRAERIGDDADLLLVGAEGDDGTLGIELFLEHDDLALDLVAGGLDDVEPLVQDQLLPGLERLGLDRWVEVHLDLPTLREDVDGPVLVGGEVDAVRRRRVLESDMEAGRNFENPSRLGLLFLSNSFIAHPFSRCRVCAPCARDSPRARSIGGWKKESQGWPHTYRPLNP